MSKLLILCLMLAATAANAADQCSPACDLNGDGASTTIQDYAVFIASYGKSAGQTGFNPKADLDDNGTVTARDFGMLSKFCPLR